MRRKSTPDEMDAAAFRQDGERETGTVKPSQIILIETVHLIWENEDVAAVNRWGWRPQQRLRHVTSVPQIARAATCYCMQRGETKRLVPFYTPV